jgi:hypothetical protein
LEQQKLALALQQGNTKAQAAAKHLSQETRKADKSGAKRQREEQALTAKAEAEAKLKEETKAAEDTQRKKEQRDKRNSTQTTRRTRAKAAAKEAEEPETPAQKRYKKDLAATALNFALKGRGTKLASASTASKARLRLAKLDDLARASYGVLYAPLTLAGPNLDLDARAATLLSEGYTSTPEGFFKKAA